MELDRLWDWDRKKLACRIRPENGNPAGDSLRETFAELAGVDLNDLLNEMKNTKKKKETTNKVSVDFEAEKSFKEVLGRSRIIGAAKLALDKMEEFDHVKSTSITQKNKKKLYTVLPKSPPKRVMLDIVRERSRPLRLPDQEEHKATTDKLEKKLAKQRAARMAAIEQSAKEESVAKQTQITMEEALASLSKSGVFNTYQGDLFSTGGHYLDGMLYLSRMADSSIRSKRTTASGDLDQKNLDDITSNVESEKALEREGSMKKDIEEASFSETSANPDMNAKLTCAVSLCNWSRNPANASRLASEGAVRAIMTLSLEPSNKIIVYCSAAFRFMSEHTVLATSMIEEGAITAIADILSSKSDDFIIYNLAIALVNLTRITGKEAQLVEGAIILALSNLIQQKPELAPTCVRGLYNLTCVDSYYTSIEKIIGKLVNLVTSGTANVKHLYAATLCNLSDLKSLRARMVEEGAITALSTLSRGAETRTRRICAVILQNLSAAKSVRVEMASRNSVAVAYALSSDQDPIILRCIGLTLSRLAMEPSNCQRIIHEGGIAALCNIAVKYPSIPGITQPVASAFQLLSNNPGFRVNIVNEGCVTAVASLLRSSADMFTLQHSLLALCNLLCEAENHLPIIQQGLILTLISMSSNENNIIKDFCSLAFLNLSSAEDSRKHLVNAGAVTAIIALAKENSEITKRRCAATFCNLSYYALGMSRMVSDGIIPAIVDLVLAKDMVTVHCSCAALCRLCSTVENARLILDSGAVPNLVQGAIVGDQVTKQFCGSVLSTLSFYEYCRVPLVEFGAIAALKGLADLNDDITKQRCLLAFANLSGEVSVQSKMIQEGVVSIIAELANSYREVNYMCCAKAICNLACSENLKMAVAKEGGIHALLMISMVQSVDRLTKFVCVLGLNNLLDATTMEFMVSEGIIVSMANLSKLEDAHISNLCAKVLNQLSKYELARQKMVERSSTLHALFKMAEASALETQIVATRTCCNLLLDEHVRQTVMKAGILPSMERGLSIEHKDSKMQCLRTIFSLCSESGFMEMISKSTLPFTLCSTATNAKLSADEYDLVTKIIGVLCFDKKSRFFLQKPGFLQLILNVLQQNYRPESAVWLLSGLSFLMIDFADTTDLLNMGLLIILQSVHRQLLADTNAPYCQESYRSIVEIISSLAESAAVLPELANILSLLLSALQVVDKPSALEHKSSFSRDWVIYHIAVLLYKFSSQDISTRHSTATAETRFMLEILAKYRECSDLVVTSYGMYLMDQKCRAMFTNATSAEALVTLYSYGLSEQSLSNIVLAFYAMSKVAACREFMMASPLHIDKILLNAATSENAKIKANANRAYKTLNADINEAIEEGAVAQLIAMSIEGKLKNQASDDFALPELVPMPENKLSPPLCCQDILPNDSARASVRWYAKVVVAKGGAAGKGPDPPEAPSVTSDDNHQYSSLNEDLDVGEADAKPRMSFAKMQIAQNLKESYLLTDEDFMLNMEREDATLADTESTEIRTDSIEEGQSLNVEESQSPGQVRSPMTRANSSRGGNRGSKPGLSRGSTSKSIDEIESTMDGESTDEKKSIGSGESPGKLKAGLNSEGKRKGSRKLLPKL